MKKFKSVIIGLIAMIAFSTTTFAYEDKSFENEAKEFLRSKNIYLGEIIEVHQEYDEITFDVSYLPSGEISQISYKKYDNGKIDVTIIEEDVEDYVEFMPDGTVYIDNIKTDMFDNNSTMVLSDFAVYYTRTCPPASGGTFPKYYGKVNDATLTFDRCLKTLTISIIKVKLADIFKVPMDETEVLTDIAKTLQKRAAESKKLRYSGTIYMTSTSAPVQNFYKYSTTYTSVETGDVISDVFYKVETLL